MRNDWFVEKVKTSVIVVLFLSAILLLYFFWKGSTFEDIKFPLAGLPGENLVITKPSEIVMPKNVQVTFGADNYTLYSAKTRELWNQFLKEYITFSESENIFVEEIPAAKWRESMLMKSIRYEFSYSLPLSYLDALGATNIPQAESISSFSVIAYSIASKESIFVYDSINDKYYRMVSDADYTTLDARISELEAAPHDTYYPINMFYGINNDTLLPYQLQIALQPLYSSNEIADSSKDYERQIAEKFFGESLDFIRKITEDDGTIIYMYGVGQKLLTLDPRGIVEYTEELNNSYSQLSYYNSMKLASKFVSTHGNWLTLDGDPLDPYLEYSTKLSLDSKKEGYRFAFSLKQNDYPLYCINGPQIIVEVVGDQVIYYKRRIDITHKSLNEPTEVAPGQPVSIIELLPAKYSTLSFVLDQNDRKVSDTAATVDEQFDSVVEQITAVSVGYFKQRDQDTGASFFVPTWVISLSSIDVFFDLYTGTYLGYTDEGAR